MYSSVVLLKCEVVGLSMDERNVIRLNNNLTARIIPGLRPISSRTVRNRLREHNIRPRRRAIRPIVLLRHCAARLTLFKRRPERLWFLVLPDCLNRLHNDSIVLRRQPKCLATTFCASPAWSIPIARRR
jgi:hypothetical protein